MRRSDELISLLRDHSHRLLEDMKSLYDEYERLKMWAYTKGFDYDYAMFESKLDKALNEISSLIEVVQEVADVLIDESAPAQVKQVLEQMSEKLDSLFQASRDAVKTAPFDREMSESLFNDIRAKIKELIQAAEEIENGIGLIIGLIEKRADEFDLE